jgi:hypothetical protein
MFLHTGVGVDAVLVKGLGVNLEIGALAPRDELASGVGLFSPGATFYWRRAPDRKVDPFVAGGYSLMFRAGHANLWYFSGGANYWFARRIGLRMEARDHATTGCCLTGHFWGMRLGMAFR